MAANLHATRHQSQLKTHDKVNYKGKFHKQVTIDDEKIRDRDKEAFKRSNPMAYQEI